MSTKVDTQKDGYGAEARSPKSRQRSAPAKDPVFPGQHEGELVRFTFRQHPVVMRKPLIFGLLIIVVGILPLDFPFVYEVPWLSSLCVKIAFGAGILAVLVWFYYWALWYYSCTVVTMERIVWIKQRGFFKREVDALFHGRIHALDYKISGLYASFLGFGELTFLTEVGNFYTKCVPHVETVHQEILGVIRDNREDDWTGNEEVM